MRRVFFQTNYCMANRITARFSLLPYLQKRILSFSILLVSALSCMSPASGQEKREGSRHPNVLFIAIDDLNDWLGYMEGHPDVKTPNIDRLAARGAQFKNAYCQAPLCGPSRASVMTGLRPSTTGIYGMIDDNKIREDNASTRDIIFLPEYFKRQGYHTMGIGKLFHQHAPDEVFDESAGRARGFGPVPKERFKWSGKGPENYSGTSTDWGAYPATDSLMPDYQSALWASERLQRSYDKPFFLAVGFLRPHVPLYVPQKWFDLYDAATLKMPPYRSDDLNDIPHVGLQINDLPMMPQTEWAIESREWPNIVQAYLASISFVDAQVGKLLTALGESGHADNTIIVMWSDHGYRMGEKGTFAKHALWEEATKSPLIFAGPGVPSGKVVEAPVELLSIYPTLLELSGLPVYARNEGKSLVALMHGKDKTKARFALTTYGMNNHAVRTKDYRYIRYEDGTEELYDHRKDPNEWTNIADDKSQAKTITRMRRYLPEVNVHWTKHSAYNFQPYFREQKMRSEEASDRN